MIKISVIMPSFNVGEYIIYAVKSALLQTLSEIEVICIDAASSDGTWEILNGMAKKDERITLVRTSIRSYGYQVNLGITLARGEYIAILETDDFVERNMYESLYRRAVEDNLDFIKADYRAYWTQNNGEKVFLNRRNPENDDLYDKVICPKEYPTLGADDWYLWTGIYRKSFIIAHNIRFSETKGAAFQDIGFLIRTMQTAERTMYVRDRFYNYCIDREGASSNMGKGLELSYVEFNNIPMKEVVEAGGEELYYSRMAKSFICCTADIQVEELDNANNWRYFDWFVEQLKKGIEKGSIKEGNIAKSLWEKTSELVDDGIESIRQDDRHKKVFIESLSSESGKSKVVIFGCGNYGYGAYRWMQNENISIAAFMDNNSNLWGTNLNDIPVMNPIACSKLPDDMKYIIANDKYADDIKTQLLGLGIKEENLYIF